MLRKGLRAKINQVW